jgi:hypothetical protein
LLFTFFSVGPAHAWSLRGLLGMKPKGTTEKVVAPKPVVAAEIVVKPTPAETVAAPKPLDRIAVERRVSLLRNDRFSAGFDASFRETVAMLKELHAVDRAAAQDLAAKALHSYMDHHRIDLGYHPVMQELVAKTTASQAGLREVLGW